MKCKILAGLALLTVLAGTESAPAQTTHTDSIHRRNNCRLAAQVLTTGHPETRKRWAQSYIGYCPSDVQGAALRVALTRAAAEGDIRTFRPLATAAIFVPDDQLLDLLLSVAVSSTNTEAIRIAALLQLDVFRNPTREWDIEELRRGDGTDCPTLVRSHPVEFAVFRPQPTAFLPRLDAGLSALAADPAQPVAVRRLAQCM